METLKAWLTGAVKSWTVRFNAFMGVLAGVITELPTALPDLVSVVPPEIYKYLLIISVLGNTVLRAKTNTALKYK